MSISNVLLDPRPAAEAATRPVTNAVNIPANEITNRIYELPAPGETVIIANVDDHARNAFDILNTTRRRAELTENWSYASEPPPRDLRLWSPSPFLEEMTAALTPGTALDIGCGTGRDAVFLANRGWNVVAVDILPDALDRARKLEQRYSTNKTPIHWHEADARSWQNGLPESITNITATFDLIYAIRFVAREAFRTARRHLTENGHLLIEAFTPTHRAKHGKPTSDNDVLTPNDHKKFTANMNVKISREKQVGTAHLTQLFAKV